MGSSVSCMSKAEKCSHGNGALCGTRILRAVGGLGHGAVVSSQHRFCQEVLEVRPHRGRAARLVVDARQQLGIPVSHSDAHPSQHINRNPAP